MCFSHYKYSSSNSDTIILAFNFRRSDLANRVPVDKMNEIFVVSYDESDFSATKRVTLQAKTN